MPTPRSTRALAAIGLLALTIFGRMVTAQAPAPVDGFIAREFRGAGGNLSYRLFIPEHYDAARAYPLMLYLHGGAGVGRDNLAQISGGNRLGTRLWTSADVQARQPTFVLAPQSVDKGWQPRAQLVVDLIGNVGHVAHVDPSRTN